MIYAGIGARSTPPQILLDMMDIAARLATDGWLLRSGGADGADKAFEQGCDGANGCKEIWLPWRGFNRSSSPHVFNSLTHARALDIAASLHPAWGHCSVQAERLHARNVLQILGADLQTPVDRVICWTPGGQLVGGTATALRLAQQHNIPITNLAIDSDMQKEQSNE